MVSINELIQSRGRDYYTGNKARSNYMLFTGDTFRFKDTNRLKVKEWEKICHHQPQEN